MGRPKGAIAKIAEELDVDPKTVRRALEAVNMRPEQAEENFDNAVEIVRSVVDNECVIGHQATRVTMNPAIANSRRRLEELKAKQLEIEIQQTERKLVSRDSVTETGARIFAEIRTALLSLGPRIAPKAINKADAREIARIVETEVRDVLGQLADEDRFFTALESEALG
jgi:hypothetical protein